MRKLPNNIDNLLLLNKTISSVPEWDEDSDPRYFVFSIPLVLEKNNDPNFLFRVKTSKRHVDRDAMCQLEYLITARRTCPLWRCEWRPFGSHVNKAWGPKGFELASIVGSHEHPFRDNWLDQENRLRGANLPGARPIDPDLHSLSAFLAYCGEQFKITGTARINLPSTPLDIFWTNNE